jgi:hypothetical protein
MIITQPAAAHSATTGKTANDHHDKTHTFDNQTLDAIMFAMLRLFGH